MYRVFLLTNYPEDLTTFSGGVETATAGLLDGLVNYLDEIELFVGAINSKGTNDTFKEKKGVKFFFITPHLKILRPRSFWAGLKVFSLVKKIKPDIVHINGNIILGFWSLFLRQKKIYSIHGIPKKEKKIWSGKDYGGIVLESLLQNFVFRGYKNIILLSDKDKKYLKPVQKFFIIPNAVRENFLQSQNKNKKQRFRIIFVGGLSRMKGVDLIIDVFERILIKSDTYILTLVGEIKDEYVRNKLHNLSEQVKSKIELINNLSVEKLIDYFGESKVLLLPSLQENMPIVILEAMACGVPVIASKVGAIPEIIEDNANGLLTEVSENSLFEKLNYLLENDEVWNRLAKSAKSKILNEFSPEVISKKHIETYKKVMNENSITS